jgi:predicted helicase
MDKARGERPKGSITVVFSTYQSLGVLTAAQEAGLGAFDLLICDEAHRTTGVTLSTSDESNFVRVHDDRYLSADKRLYMTATPRLYDDASKAKAQEADALLCSMDDESLYGPELHRLGFGEAVGAGLLSDYKVLVLAVDEGAVSRTFQRQLASPDHELNLDDAARIVGCWNGLSKRGIDPRTFEADPGLMQRAVAFSRSIKDSKRFTNLFAEIIGEAAASNAGDGAFLSCDAEHVDGTFNALVRNEKLDWLRADPGHGNCRILSNARCLSEGVDVPALDAVLFLNPRNSVVDVVQSVGRVMRKAEGKTYGYVILPIGIPTDQSPEEALADNRRYKVVWQVLQALRAHDDRFNAMVNKLELNADKGDQIQVIGASGFEESDSSSSPTAVQGRLALGDLDAWRDAIFAKLVIKVGDRRYWEDWATDVADIASRHVARIEGILANPDTPAAHQFEAFLAGLHQNLNDSITPAQAIDMLAQHLVTKPVFDALFEDYAFAEHNPVSKVMQAMVDALSGEQIDRETESLASFYDSVRLRAQGIDNAAGKQRVITELYERFFKTAFPKMADSLGVVYTPIEIVDFVVRSVESVLRDEFGASLSDEGVHVLDPFTGTGTFIVRLIQSGVIDHGALARKYASDLHANEIVLLAYYLAAVNIEAAFHHEVGGSYQPFDGIVLTDTFQQGEGDPADDVYFPDNNARLQRQKDADITVVLGNPPYSVGQASENDNNQNLRYPKLDGRIRNTYAARSSAALKNSLYDSYIRAFRWASDRIGDRGIVCFVTNGAFVDSGSADGFRKTLADEFSAIWCLNLRGNQRTSGETSRREGGKIFGQGSRTPVAVTLLVKNPGHTGPATISYHDIGDYLSREEKLAKVVGFADLSGVDWQPITPNEAGDWVNQRSQIFETFAPLGNKKDAGGHAIFETYSNGVKTNRDAWAYNFSRSSLLANMERTIDAYNKERKQFHVAVADGVTKATDASVNGFIDTDPTRVSWTVNLKSDLRKNKAAALDSEHAVPSMYRPFCKQWLYFDRQWNERVLLMPSIFPTPAHENRVIAVSGIAGNRRSSALVTSLVPDIQLQFNGQCFPRYRYTLTTDDGTNVSMLGGEGGYERHDAISAHTLDRYRQSYGVQVTPDDVFHYVYGLLHSLEYTSRFAAELGKMIPRIPMVEDFWAFSRAGAALAVWHLGYESVEPWPLDGLPDEAADPKALRVDKMRFASKDDHSSIVVNSHIKLSGIPEDAYHYQVNGRSAIEWIIDRYQVKTDKASGIVNDPNTWSDDPRYIVDLLARIVRVSMESVAIIDGLSDLGPL